MIHGKSERSWVLTPGALVIVSLAVFGWRGNEANSPQAGPPNAAASNLPPFSAGRAAEGPEPWNKPPAQGRGAGWVYEVFTPPEIFFDAASRRFRVATQNLAELRSPVASDSGLELLEIIATEFPLQLVGYVGEEQDYRGIFVNIDTTETFLAGAGRAVPELGLIIMKFTVSPKSVALVDSMTVTELVAEAIVRHVTTGEEIVLTDRERGRSGAGRARLRILADEAVVWEAEEGEICQIAGEVYRIEKIRLAPPSVSLSKETVGVSNPVRHTLTLPATLQRTIR